MHDTSDLELRGIPTTYVASGEFVDAAEAQAKSLGFPHSPVYVEHPIQDRTDEEMTAIGAGAFEELVARLLVQR